MGAATVVVVGAGGNIGSQLVPHLARMAEVGRLVLVDRDEYEARNRWNQDPGGRASGGKAAKQAARARRLNPGLAVLAVRDDIETMPVGRLRGDLIVGCLDSRRARLALNQAAWRLGVPWLDGGVRADGLLARVTRYHPGPGLPCLECAWGDADYAALEQRHPCGATAVTPTGAPSGLGALAASLLALECQKLLGGEGRPLAPGTTLVMDAAFHRHYLTASGPSPCCRLTGHAPWAIEPFAGPATPLASLLAIGAGGPGGTPTLSVDGRRFVRALRCTGCGSTRRPWRLEGRDGARGRRCRRCGAVLAASGWDLADSLEGLPARYQDRPLAAFGLRPGDVVTLAGADRDRHFELVDP